MDGNGFVAHRISSRKKPQPNSPHRRSQSARQPLERDHKSIRIAGNTDTQIMFLVGVVARADPSQYRTARVVRMPIVMASPSMEVEHLGAVGAVEGATRFLGGSLSILVEKDLECLAPRDGESRTNRVRNSKARE
jgi:hypothetical protein